MKRHLKAVPTASLALFFMASFGQAQPSTEFCKACSPASFDGQCIEVAPGAGFGFKNCSVEEVTIHITVVINGQRISLPITRPECHTSNACLLPPPF
ncbi:MAG: hypothetical protein AAGF23_21895 [Acidobacteriota bacterium]